MPVSRGPKAKVSVEPLPWRPRGSESERFVQFCRKFLIVPNGHGAGKPLVIREWQRELVASVLDDPVPRVAGWLIARGNGKSSLAAALAVYKLFTSDMGGSIVCCARNQSQAQILFRIARSFVETSPELLARCQVGRELLYVPRNRTDFECLVSEPESLAGRNYSFCIVDELGVTPRETVDVLMTAQGKRPESTLLGIGTPPPDGVDSVMVEWRELAGETGEELITWREFTADGFDHHDLFCEHCIRLASPAYGDFLAMDVLRRDAKLVGPVRFRRDRLCQFVSGNENPFISQDIWDSLSTGEGIPDGADVVVALDGSHSRDCTALLIGTVSSEPHFDTLQVWAKPPDSPGWRVPVLEVEDAIRTARHRWNVRELTADPFRWNRTLQILASEGMTVSEFPWSPSRITQATTDLYSAAANGRMSHSGEKTLTNHVMAATVIDSPDGGLRISKVAPSRRNAPKVDLCSCLVMAHSRATWLASRPKKRKRGFSF
ncbi:terminase large subunit domain-containing protein [Mycolicibacterium sphagni]|uniref:Terminase n=1 Tax=Mycolicibacterium sphagni TaxID=1786 RepID=A0A255DKL0_9MYCO|nr:terminase large subunit [Mycolicibacterium sphagni]OYN79987.1 terminase [Mycolicibacterium sphagni]